MSARVEAGVGKRAWGAPLARFHTWWVSVEQALCVGVILAEIGALLVWVSMKGLSSPYDPVGGGTPAGLVYRGSVGAMVVGTVAHLATRRWASGPGKQGSVVHPLVVTAGVLVGALAARAWANTGVVFVTNVQSWVQNASVFMLVGGLRGVVTRLTLLLALLGGSIATSKGKHINVDVMTRSLPVRFAAPIAVVGWLATAAVCFAATWGFVDSISVTRFRAEPLRACAEGEGRGVGTLCDTPIGERWGKVRRGVASDAFLFGRQLSLDVTTLPHVLAGEPYDTWMSASRWNEWVRGGGWERHFAPDEVATLIMPEGGGPATRLPAVSEPGTGEGRGLLVRDLNFVLPWGLFLIGLKFLVRILLVLSGHVKVDPTQAHGDEDLRHAEEPAS